MAKATAARRPLVVRFVKRENPHLEGSAASYVFTEKTGRHFGYEVTETANGVELRKDGKLTLVPWPLVQQIEYADA